MPQSSFLLVLQFNGSNPRFFHGLFVIFILGLVFGSGCSRSKPESTPHETPVDMDRINRIINSIPPDKPDMYLKVIGDSARNEDERLKMCNTALGMGIRMKPDDFRYLADGILNTFGRVNPSIHTIALGMKGRNYFRMGKRDSAKVLIELCLNEAETSQDSGLLSFAYQEMANVYMYRNLLSQSLEYLYKAIDYLPQVSRGHLADLVADVGMNYDRQRNYPKSKEAFFRSFALKRTEGDSAAMMLYALNLAQAYANLGMGDSVLWAADQAYAIAQKLNDSTRHYNIYLHWGQGNSLKGNASEALAYSQKAALLAEQRQDLWAKFRAETNIANCVWQMGQLDKAEALYWQVFEGQRERMGAKINIPICDSLVRLSLAKAGNTRLLTYLRKVSAFRDSLFNRERVQIWEDMSVRYHTLEKEAQIKKLELEKRNNQLYFLAIVFAFSVVLGLTAWFIYRGRQKHILLQSEKELLASKQTLLLANQRVQEQELANHKIQLEDFQKNIVLKNQLIVEMEGRMAKLLADASCISDAELEQNKSALANMKILTEDDWLLYLKHFEKVYPDFIGRLKSRFEGLSTGEIRQLVMVYQGFSRTQIADMLGISSESVRKNQYRLRKKLGIEEHADLASSLHAL